MTIAELYLNLVNNPHIPKVYRDLYFYYKHNDLLQEARAFEDLLLIQFGEHLVETSDSPNLNPKQ